MPRNKSPQTRIPTQTKNPCNQFLIQYLLKLRQKQTNFKMMQTITSHRHNNKSFMDHQYHLYTKAIDSIKKYPLPIICEEQLGMLAGIGGTLAGKLVHVIRLYYRKFMKGVEGGVDEGIWNGQGNSHNQRNNIGHGNGNGQKQKEKQKDHVKTLNWTVSSSQNSSIKSIKQKSYYGSQCSEKSDENNLSQYQNQNQNSSMNSIRSASHHKVVSYHNNKSQCNQVLQNDMNVGKIHKNKDNSSQSEHNSQNRDKIHPFPTVSQFPLQYDKKSNKSQNSYNKTNKNANSINYNYKPRPNSQTSFILKSLHFLNAQTNSITKNQINQHLTKNGQQKIKQWNNAKQILIKNGYIELDPSVQKQAYFLTNKGVEYNKEKQREQRGAVSKKKIMEEINIFKQKIIEQQKQKQQASNSVSMSKSQSQIYKSKINYSQSFISQPQNSQSNSKNYTNTKSFPNSINEPFTTRKPLIKNPSQNLILVVDTRQMKDQQQKSYFQQTFTQKYKIDIITNILSIGDFVFTYNGQVLDYVIQRKKADDLAASILDGRYKQQKYRLKNSGANNIIYLYEGYPSEGSVLKQKQLMSALTKTRACDKFSIVKTSKITQTTKYLYHIYTQLQKRINNENPCTLNTIGTLEQFNKRNTKSRYLTVQNIFGFGLKLFPNVGKQTVANLLRYFKSYYALYKELKRYQGNQDKVEFLNGLLKGGRTQAGVTALIVQFMFGAGTGNEQNNKIQSTINNSQISNPINSNSTIKNPKKSKSKPSNTNVTINIQNSELLPHPSQCLQLQFQQQKQKQRQQASMNIINKSNYKGRVINENVGEKEKEKEKSVEKYSDWREYVLKRQRSKQESDQ